MCKLLEGSCSLQLMKLEKVFIKLFKCVGVSCLGRVREHWDQESSELHIYLPVGLQKVKHETLQVAAAAVSAWGSSEWKEGGAVTTHPADRSLQVPSPSSVTDGRGLHACVTVSFPWGQPSSTTSTTGQQEPTTPTPARPVKLNCSSDFCETLHFDTEGYSGCRFCFVDHQFGDFVEQYRSGSRLWHLGPSVQCKISLLHHRFTPTGRLFGM